MSALHDDPQARSYWTNLLADGAFTQVPRLRPATSAVPDVRVRGVEITRELSGAITVLARRHSVPIDTIALAAHVLVLSQLAGQADIVTGWRYSGRPEEEGTSPFRVNVDAHSWTALIRRVFEAEADLRPFRRYPLSSINRDLQIAAPLFEVVFDFTSSYLPRSLQRDGGSDPLDVRVQSKTEFVLRAEFSHNADTDDVVLGLRYQANLFDEDHIERIGGYYRRALELMTADGASPGAQSLLSDDEIHRVSVLFNQTDTNQDVGRLAHRYFEDHVQRAPERTAIRFREQCWSYGLLNQRANRVALALTSLNLPDEACVAVYMDRNLDWAATVLGVFKAGVVYVAVEPTFPEERAGQLIEQSRCRVVITEAAHEAKLARALAIKNLSCDIQLAATMQAGSDAAPNPPADFDSTRLAYVFFTSGSTGVPKGAAIEHRGMVNHLFAKIHDLDITEVDTVAQNSPLGFDISVWQLLSPLMVGASVVIYDHEQVLDVVGLMRRLQADHVTVFETVPSYFRVMLDALESAPVDFSMLRYLLLQAEVLAPSDVRRWCDLYPRNRLVNAYGATECSDDVTHYHVPGPFDARIPVGRPLQNMRIHVLDRHGHYVPPGTPGEIFCTGVGVGRGYLNLPQENARAFLTDPRGAVHGRMYRTGDIGCWTVDGDLHFLGRRDEQVKIRGFRIELDEIEHVLLTSPGVRAAAVVPRERAGGHELVAFIVSSGTTPEMLVAYLKARLPDYMTPSLFVDVDALPLSSNGKVHRSLLRSRATLLERAERRGDGPLRVLAPAESVAGHTLVDALAAEDVMSA
jgi:amino acid adenylation domain-containing protein